MASADAADGAGRAEQVDRAHRRGAVAIGSCASIGEAFRALPLEAHFASMRSRVCVAIAHRHAPDHFDVVLAVAAMLFAVLRQCAARAGLHVHRVFVSPPRSPLSNVAVDIESSTLL